MKERSIVALVLLRNLNPNPLEDLDDVSTERKRRFAIQEEQADRFRTADLAGNVRFCDLTYDDELLSDQLDGDVVISTGTHLIESSAFVTLNDVDADVAIGIERFSSCDRAKKACEALAVDTLIETDGNEFSLSPDRGELPDARTLGVIRVAEDVFDLVEKHIKKVHEEVIDGPEYYLSRIISRLQDCDVSIGYANVSESVRPFDESYALARYLLGTKADTLDRLRGIVDHATIPPQFSFDVTMWNRNHEDILDTIDSRFSGSRVVVRSSATIEDGWDTSQAGVFHSELDVPVDRRARLAEAIENVVDPLEATDSGDDPGQVLVQPQINDIALSGVSFTRDLDSGSPYTVINYDDVSGRTDTVTGGDGAAQRTAYFYQVDFCRAYADMDADLTGVKRAVDELRALLDDPPLDLEFAVAENGEIILFQVRPLPAHVEGGGPEREQINERIHSVETTVTELNRDRDDLLGETTVLGIMPDWNPAEMIGVQPDPLAVSLYRYLITDETWARARTAMGYRDVRPVPLLRTLSSRPYIDTLASFNSFLPASLPDPIGRQLIGYYVDRLAERPQLQDSIEFDVAFTCLDFEFPRRKSQLVTAGFTEQTIATIRRSLKHLTESIVNEEVTPLTEQQDRLRQLAQRRKQLLTDVPADWQGTVRRVECLLDDAREFGTLPFSILARDAFIATALLESLRDRDVLSRTDYETISRGIPTIARDFTADVTRLQRGELNSTDFLRRYGHLRPGTYDICSPRYDTAPEQYFNITSPNTDPLQFDRERSSIIADWNPDPSPDATALFERSQDAIQQVIDEVGFGFSPDDLFDFIVRAIPLRELAKFTFTRNLSSALLLLRRRAQTHFQLSAEELANLHIGEILVSANESDRSRIRHRFRELIRNQRRQRRIDEQIQLPPVITDAHDVLAFEISSERPTYITNQRVAAPTIGIDTKDESTHESIDGNLILIPSADPGYDWIFSSNIAGLITKYGGVASHMAIRAREFEIPAAIGCGEVVFEQIANADIVKLDCESGQIRAVR